MEGTLMTETREIARFRWMNLANSQPLVDGGLEVIQGLSHTPKTLPCRYFYDDRGSLLFERICTLPEYYVTQTEQAILESCAAEIAQLTGLCERFIYRRCSLT